MKWCRQVSRHLQKQLILLLSTSAAHGSMTSRYLLAPDHQAWAVPEWVPCFTQIPH